MDVASTLENRVEAEIARWANHVLPELEQVFSKTRILVLLISAASLILASAVTGVAQTNSESENGHRSRSGTTSSQRQSRPATTPAIPQNATHVDFDAYMQNRQQRDAPTFFTSNNDMFPNDMISSSGDLYQDRPTYNPAAVWQLLPDGMVYDSYLAGTHEARFALHMMDINAEGAHFAGFLGARVPILRYGTTDAIRPEGFQIDAEGLANVRIDLADDWVVDAADFRGGLPLSYGYGRHRTKLGYYHLSSHVQDEFLAANPGFTRLNFSRDVFILGHSYYVTDQLRIYGEVGYAFISDVSDPWEFQVGLDYAPMGPTGIRGGPFFALNGHLREEVNFGGALTAQLGWAWVGDTGKMLRTGLHYYNGESNQYSFFDRFEQQIGFGLWYDF